MPSPGPGRLFQFALVFWSPGPKALPCGLSTIRDQMSPKRLLGRFLLPKPVSSLEALRHVGQGHGEGLHSREGVLEVQNVRIAIDPAELHHLEGGIEAKTLGDKLDRHPGLRLLMEAGSTI